YIGVEYAVGSPYSGDWPSLAEGQRAVEIDDPLPMRLWKVRFEPIWGWSGRFEHSHLIGLCNSKNHKPMC
ncbi:MAG TPA: hypothetical protein VF678_00140, partial [bacterium]